MSRFGNLPMVRALAAEHGVSTLIYSLDEAREEEELTRA